MGLSMRSGVLDRSSILELLREPEPLVEGYLDLKTQAQPNGFDLTLCEVSEFTTAGEIGPGGSPSELSGSKSLAFGEGGYLQLPMGAYLVTVNEILNLPRHIMALGRPRSSLLRCGVAIHTAVWDAGYRGRSQALLTVYNPMGYRVAKDARVLQLVFIHTASPTQEGYSGRFLGENI